MDKSRQRQYQTVKSSLNITREIVILFFTALFWLYCWTSLIVIGGTLLHLNTDSVLFVRSVLNIENSDMDNIFKLMGIFLIVIFVLLTYLFIVQKVKERKEGKIHD